MSATFVEAFSLSGLGKMASGGEPLPPESSFASDTEHPDELTAKDLNAVQQYLSLKKESLESVLEELITYDENNRSISPRQIYEKEELMNFRVRFLSCLLDEIKNEHPQEWKLYPSQIKINLTKVMKEEVDNARSLLAASRKKLARDKKNLEQMESRITTLEEMIKKGEENLEEPEGKSLRQLGKKVNDQFLIHRRKFSKFLKDEFPPELVNMLEELSQRFFEEEGDPYISLPNDSALYKHVERLLNLNIATRHPHDPSKIRLTNFAE